MKIIIEAFCIGIISALVGIIISTIFMLPSKNFSWKKYDFYPQILLSYFLTGFIIHICFEISGGNKWYCKHGNACKNN
jgi:hypothetical protein